MYKMVMAFVLAAISSALYAQNGVVLIDQKAALSGKVTPGDEPGFPVTISLPGSYRLAGNLTVPDAMTTGIQIKADDVSLDLSGFSIIGPNVCTPDPATCTFNSGNGVGVHSSDFSAGTLHSRNVRVFNGTVRGMGFHGVRLPGDGSVVERVTANSNGGPGILSNGSVIDSVSTLNGVGIISSTVRGSIAAQNRLTGIFGFPNSGGVVTGNNAYFNGDHGIVVGAGSTVSGNTANNNHTSGIVAACPSSIFGNTTVGNQGGTITTPGGCTLVNNAP